MAAATGIACRQPEQAQRIIQVVVPPLEELAPKPPEEKITIPADLSELMSKLKTWRKSLPEQVRVRIVDYGPQLLSAKVLSEAGIRVRTIPDVNSPVSGLVPWLTWGREFEVRYEIVKRGGEGGEERWMVLDENYDNLVRWQCSQAGSPGQGRCFVPAQLGEEFLISIEQPRQNPTNIDWTRTPSP